MWYGVVGWGGGKLGYGGVCSNPLGYSDFTCSQTLIPSFSFVFSWTSSHKSSQITLVPSAILFTNPFPLVPDDQITNLEFRARSNFKSILLFNMAWVRDFVYAYDRVLTNKRIALRSEGDVIDGNITLV